MKVSVTGRHGWWVAGRVAVTLGFGLGIASCCCPHASVVPFVAVRKEQLRSERYALPLNPDARSQLLMYLSAGGDKSGIDEGNVITLVYPDAENRWGGLLTALGDPANVDADDLTNGTYTAWLPGTPLRQLIDATAARPPLACPPYALSQERFVWIFECGDTPGKLGRVFVQVAVGARENN